MPKFLFIQCSEDVEGNALINTCRQCKDHDLFLTKSWWGTSFMMLLIKNHK